MSIIFGKEASSSSGYTGGGIAISETINDTLLSIATLDTSKKGWLSASGWDHEKRSVKDNGMGWVVDDDGKIDVLGTDNGYCQQAEMFPFVGKLDNFVYVGPFTAGIQTDGRLYLDADDILLRQHIFLTACLGIDMGSQVHSPVIMYGYTKDHAVEIFEYLYMFNNSILGVEDKSARSYFFGLSTMVAVIDGNNCVQVGAYDPNDGLTSNSDEVETASVKFKIIAHELSNLTDVSKLVCDDRGFVIIPVMEDGTCKFYSQPYANVEDVFRFTDEADKVAVEAWTGIDKVFESVSTDGKSIFVIGLKTDGTCVVSNATDVRGIGATSLTGVEDVGIGSGFAAFLLSDGTVTIIGTNTAGDIDTSTYTNIVEITVYDEGLIIGDSSGTDTELGTIPENTSVGTTTGGDPDEIIAVLDDGTCEFYYYFDFTDDYLFNEEPDKTTVESWTGISNVRIKISDGEQSGFVIGIKTDGTCVVSNTTDPRGTGVTALTNVEDVGIGSGFSVFLHTDGTITVIGTNTEDDIDTSSLTDIITICVTDEYICAIDDSGTAHFTGTVPDDISDVDGVTVITGSGSSTRVVLTDEEGSTHQIGDSFFGYENSDGALGGIGDDNTTPVPVQTIDISIIQDDDIAVYTPILSISPIEQPTMSANSNGVYLVKSNGNLIASAGVDNDFIEDGATNLEWVQAFYSLYYVAGCRDGAFVYQGYFTYDYDEGIEYTSGFLQEDRDLMFTKMVGAKQVAEGGYILDNYGCDRDCPLYLAYFDQAGLDLALLEHVSWTTDMRLLSLDVDAFDISQVEFIAIKADGTCCCLAMEPCPQNFDDNIDIQFYDANRNEFGDESGSYGSLANIRMFDLPSFGTVTKIYVLCSGYLYVLQRSDGSLKVVGCQASAMYYELYIDEDEIAYIESLENVCGLVYTNYLIIALHTDGTVSARAKVIYSTDDIHCNKLKGLGWPYMEDYVSVLEPQFNALANVQHIVASDDCFVALHLDGTCTALPLFTAYNNGQPSGVFYSFADCTTINTWTGVKALVCSDSNIKYDESPLAWSQIFVAALSSGSFESEIFYNSDSYSSGIPYSTSVQLSIAAWPETWVEPEPIDDTCYDNPVPYFPSSNVSLSIEDFFVTGSSGIIGSITDAEGNTTNLYASDFSLISVDDNYPDYSGLYSISI